MTPQPVTIGFAARASEAAGMLNTLEIRHLPVVDHAGAVVGILSERDLGRASVRQGALRDGEPHELDPPVAAIMTPDVFIVAPDATFAQIVDVLLDNRIGAVVVVDPVGELLVGIISYTDLLLAVRAELRSSAEG